MAFEEIDDHGLVERARDGNRRALDEIVRRHTDLLYRMAYRLTRDYDMAGDLVADTFVRVFKGIRTFKGESAVSTWLYRILMNSYLDARKRASNRPTCSLHDEALFGTEMSRIELAETRNLPDLSAISDVRCRRILEAIECLPAAQKTMVLMFHAEGMTYEEIANVCDLPIGTVKSRLNRARLLLRELLEAERDLFYVA